MLEGDPRYGKVWPSVGGFCSSVKNCVCYHLAVYPTNESCSQTIFNAIEAKWLFHSIIGIRFPVYNRDIGLLVDVVQFLEHLEDILQVVRCHSGPSVQ